MNGPARVIRLEDAKAGLDAVVVIDHELFPYSAGGTRMAPDVSEAEVARLARAMTWKFGVFGIPIAGAKAGLRFAGGDREALMRTYLEALRPYEEVFATGPDMGTSPEDFVEAYSAPGETPMWARRHEGRSMDDLATGRGVAAAAKAALEHLGRSVDGATVAIEGFGKAGSGTAIAFAQAGARVVAVSTIAGAIVNEDGFDVEELLGLRATHGDAFVEHLGARSRDALFDVECDVLVPGARPDVITPGNAGSLRCAVVAPAANAPYAEGADEALQAWGILALPDFVANAGGVHLYESPDCQGDDPEACLTSVARLNTDATRRVLARADSDGATPLAAGHALAREFLDRAVTSR